MLFVCSFVRSECIEDDFAKLGIGEVGIGEVWIGEVEFDSSHRTNYTHAQPQTHAPHIPTLAWPKLFTPHLKNTKIWVMISMEHEMAYVKIRHAHIGTLYWNIIILSIYDVDQFIFKGCVWSTKNQTRSPKGILNPIGTIILDCQNQCLAQPSTCVYGFDWLLNSPTGAQCWILTSWNSSFSGSARVVHYNWECSPGTQITIIIIETLSWGRMLTRMIVSWESGGLE